MSLGQTLRSAREAKGMTTSELAEKTHLLVQIVEGLENEDFRRIPAPIYGRGFIKLYCEQVGIDDPKPLQAEFMALYGKPRNEVAAKEMRQATPPPPPPPPPQPPVVEAPPPPPPPTPVVEAPPPPPTPVVEAAPPPTTPQPVVETPPQPPTPQPVVETQPPPPPSPVPVAEPPPAPPPPPPPPAPETKVPEIFNEPPPRKSYGELFEHSYANAEPKKPSAADKFRDTMSNVSHGIFTNVKKLPPNTGRMVAVALAAIVLLVLIGWGISALYTATSPRQPETEKPLPPAQTQPAATDSKPETKAPAPAPKAAPAKKEPVKAAPAKKEPAKAAPPKSATKPKKVAAAKPGELHSSNIEIPALYID